MCQLNLKTNKIIHFEKYQAKTTHIQYANQTISMTDIRVETTA